MTGAYRVHSFSRSRCSPSQPQLSSERDHRQRCRTFQSCSTPASSDRRSSQRPLRTDTAEDTTDQPREGQTERSRNARTLLRMQRYLLLARESDSSLPHDVPPPPPVLLRLEGMGGSQSVERPPSVRDHQEEHLDRGRDRSADDAGRGSADAQTKACGRT